MATLSRVLLVPALGVFLLLAVQEGAGHRLLSADDSSSNSRGPALCTNPSFQYTIKQDDTPKKIVTAVYPNSAVPWRKLWGIIKACNRQHWTAAATASPASCSCQPTQSLSSPPFLQGSTSQMTSRMTRRILC